MKVMSPPERKYITSRLKKSHEKQELNDDASNYSLLSSSLMDVLWQEL